MSHHGGWNRFGLNLHKDRDRIHIMVVDYLCFGGATSDFPAIDPKLLEGWIKSGRTFL